MKNWKRNRRIIALVTVIFLVLLYVATLIFALMDTPWAFTMFKVCLGLSIFLPSLLYIYTWIYKLLSKDSDENPR